LNKELQTSHPDNIGYKKDLAISYYKLGEANKTKHDNKKAKTLFQKAETLWQGLLENNPQDDPIKQELEKVQTIIMGLD